MRYFCGQARPELQETAKKRNIKLSKKTTDSKGRPVWRAKTVQELCTDLGLSLVPRRTPGAKEMSAMNLGRHCVDFKAKPGVNPFTKMPLAQGGPIFKRLTGACTGTQETKCLSKGLRQLSWTCWFNAALNGLMLGGRSSRIFHDLLQKTPAQDLALLKRNRRRGVCPMKIGKAYVLREMLEFFKHGDAKPDYQHDQTKQIVQAVIPEHKGHGGYPTKAIQEILRACFQPQEYHVDTYKPGMSITPGSKCKFLVLKSEGTSIHESVLATVPLRISGFELDHACLVVKWRRREIAHAVTAFRCDGKEYIFDSYDHAAKQMAWTGKSYPRQFFKDRYKRQVEYVYASYLCYVQSPSRP